MKNSRPFFSLIVPCYNDGRYKAGQYLDRLLTSVMESDLDRDEIEVILADDHSPIPYTRTINKFKKHLEIKTILTEYNFAPGNTRQVGTMIATGQWLCFADHDDTFYPRALRTVKDLIEHAESDPVFVYGDFDKVSGSDLSKIVEKFRGTSNNALNFVHGKFYNRDRLWKQYHLHFPKDLRTHEDIALWHQAQIVLKTLDKGSVFYVPTPIYRWTDNPLSVSNVQYKDDNSNSFLERNYRDYLTSGIGQYLDTMESGNVALTPMELAEYVVPQLLICWAQLNDFVASHPETFIKDNFRYVQEIWDRFKALSGFSSTLVIRMMMQQTMSDFIQYVNSVVECNRDILPSDYSKYLCDFNAWINNLDRKEEAK